MDLFDCGIKIALRKNKITFLTLYFILGLAWHNTKNWKYLSDWIFPGISVWLIDSGSQEGSVAMKGNFKYSTLKNVIEGNWRLGKFSYRALTCFCTIFPL